MTIVNSDDFGFDHNYNEAIYTAYKEGLISSISCMVNFQEGLKDAVSYVVQKKIDVNVIGLHANLSSGVPMTLEMAKNKRFCVNGVYKNDITIRLFFLDRKSRRQVYNELAAQVERFKEVFGKTPSHLDTHHHLHTHWGVLPIFLRVAKKFDVPVVRIARNTGFDGRIKQWYKKLVNLKIKAAGFMTVDHFGDVDDHLVSNTSPLKNREIMVHAIFDEYQNLLDMDGEDLRSKISRILGSPNDKIGRLYKFG